MFERKSKKKKKRVVKGKYVVQQRLREDVRLVFREVKDKDIQEKSKNE